MTEFREKIWEFLGQDSFANEKVDEIPALAQDNPRRLVIAVIREVIAPFINRSEDPNETITMSMSNGREVIEVPARKFKSKEKLLGLRLCKAFNVVSPYYEYNDIKNKEILDNPNSVTFGDTIVEEGRDNQGMFPSRALYSSSYSIRDKVILTRKLTHNALSQQGTMWDRKEGFRQSLFDTEYVLPGTVFPSFITLKDPTPEMLYHVIRTLDETSYGAQTSITGPNIKNHIIGILSCKIEPPISSYTISEEMGDMKDEISNERVFERAKSLIIEEMKDYAQKNGDALLSGDALSDMLNYFKSLSEDALEEVYKKLRDDSHDLWEYSGFSQTKKKNRNGNKTDSEDKPNDDSA